MIFPDKLRRARRDGVEAGLMTMLGQAVAAHPENKDVIIGSGPSIHYQDIIGVMDVARQRRARTSVASRHGSDLMRAAPLATSAESTLRAQRGTVMITSMMDILDDAALLSLEELRFRCRTVDPSAGRRAPQLHERGMVENSIVIAVSSESILLGEKPVVRVADALSRDGIYLEELAGSLDGAWTQMEDLAQTRGARERAHRESHDSRRSRHGISSPSESDVHLQSTRLRRDLSRRRAGIMTLVRAASRAELSPRSVARPRSAVSQVSHLPREFSGLVFLVSVFLTPRQPVELTIVDQVPERFAKLILEETKPLPPAITKPKIQDITRPDAHRQRTGARARRGRPGAEGSGHLRTNRPGPPRSGSRDRPPGPGTGAGKGLGTGKPGAPGRKRKSPQQLAAVTGSLNSVISEMATTLSAATATPTFPRAAGRAGVRCARDDRAPKSGRSLRALKEEVPTLPARRKWKARRSTSG